MGITKFFTFFFIAIMGAAAIAGTLNYWPSGRAPMSEGEKVIQSFLQALREKNEEEAYEAYTVEPFRQASNFLEFQRLVASYPALLNHTVTKIEKAGDESYKAMLASGDDIYQIVFALKENKIYSLQLFSPYIADNANETQISLKKITVGTKADALGVLEMPLADIPDTAEEIYVNVEILSPKRGEKVQLFLTHIESGQEAFPLSTSLQREGDSTLSFSYRSPVDGWPKGQYQVEARTNGKSISTRFTIE